jgi:predicted NAD/FAD-binding protein
MFDALPGARTGDDQRQPPDAAAAARAAGAVAVIGSGIAGLSAAWLLSRRYRVTLFEAGARLGGHSHTVDVEAGGGTIPVDTGFIVYNERTYPNLTRLFRHLGVRTAPSDMSFGVSVAGGALEYAAARRLAGLFAQKRNLLRPGFWRMLADILRFYAAFRGADAKALAGLTLGDLLSAGRYGRGFREAHLLPMAAAIWSGTFRSILDFPAACFVAFCRNHGLLQVGGRPTWRTVAGRSRDYVQRLAAGVSGPIFLNAPVAAIHRGGRGVEVTLANGARARFDRVIVAAHANTALGMLADPSAEEQRLLGAFAFQPNHAILHRDPSLMPRRRACWASWNFIAHTDAAEETPVFVTLLAQPPAEPRHRRAAVPIAERHAAPARGDDPGRVQLRPSAIRRRRDRGAGGTAPHPGRAQHLVLRRLDRLRLPRRWSRFRHGGRLRARRRGAVAGTGAAAGRRGEGAAGSGHRARLSHALGDLSRQRHARPAGTGAAPLPLSRVHAADRSR